MRIGINTLFLVPGDVGGTEVYLRNTLSAIAALDTEHVLVLFTNIENDSLLREDLADFPAVEFHQLPCRSSIRPIRIFVEQLLLPFFAKSHHVDVLWSPGYTAPAWCSLPQVVTICDLQYKSYPEDMSGIERKTLDTLVRTACKTCQAIITISEFSKQEVIKYNFTYSEKVFAVPLGVSKDFSFTDTDDSKSRISEHLLLEMGIDKPFLLCVAHTYPHKNVDKLVDAFCLLEKKISHQLVLVGKARRGEQAVQESLANIQNSSRVVRLSGLSDAELQVLYSQSDIFVLPSSYEGFGLPVVEAMMAGVPVVTPKMASLPEVGGEHAFYVNSPEPLFFAEKIVEVLGFSEERKTKHLCDAREWASGFTWERTARQTVRVLEYLIKKSR